MKRKKHGAKGTGIVWHFCMILAATLSIAPTSVVRAENNSNLIINGFATNFASVQYTGNGGTNNSIQITNGGAITNTSDWNVGYNAGDNYNSALVNNGQWSCANIYIGRSGAFDSMLITNQGVVSNGQGFVGYNASATGNWVVVTGSGSLWTNSSEVDIGASGIGHTLTIRNGGGVFQPISGSLYFYVGRNGASAHDSVLVSDASSILSAGSLRLGYNGGIGNQLTVSNGGNAFFYNTYIGNNGGASNTVLVTGSGSVLSNTSFLQVGPGNWNQVMITNQGAWYGTGVAIGDGNASNNTLVVSGAGSICSNFGAGSAFNLGYNGVAPSNSVVVSQGGKLYTPGQSCQIGNGNSYNSITVTDTTSLWFSATGINVGFGGTATGNQLIITNGGAVGAAGNATIGYNGANNNSVSIDGTGSSWTVNGTLTADATGQRMTISRGGLCTVGAAQTWWGGTNNALMVTDPGSICSNGAIYIGYDNTATPATGCQLIVTNGGTVYGGGGIGYATKGQATSCSIAIVGTNSLWVTAGGVAIYGVSNSLTIIDGRLLDTASAGIPMGGSAGPSYNSVLVSGITSVFSNNPGALKVGSGSSYNTMTVSNGATVYTAGNGGPGGVGTGGGIGNNLTIIGGTGVVSSLSFLGVTLNVGSGGTTGNVLAVNGLGVDGSAIVTNVSTLNLGTTAGDMSNSVQIVNGGRFYLSALVCTGSFNAVVATNGGLIEASSISIYGGGGNTVSNLGGVFQFYSASPTLSPGVLGAIGISGGTVSFRSITTADVFCNQSTKPLDSTNKVAWAGANGFRLNAATNLAGQNYTFTDTQGATNFARLELLNGSKYNGNITIGANGTLAVSSGNSIVSNLTMQSGSAMTVTVGSTNDYLTVTGTASLAGGTLQVVFNTNPTLLYPIHVVRTAGLGTRFANRLAAASYGGKIYKIQIQYNGDDAILNPLVDGTILLIH